MWKDFKTGHMDGKWKMKAIWICSGWNLLNTLQLFQSEEGLHFSLALFRNDSEQKPLNPQSLYKLVQVWVKLLLL